MPGSVLFTTGPRCAFIGAALVALATTTSVTALADHLKQPFYGLGVRAVAERATGDVHEYANLSVGARGLEKPFYWRLGMLSGLDRMAPGAHLDLGWFVVPRTLRFGVSTSLLDVRREDDWNTTWHVLGVAGYEFPLTTRSSLALEGLSGLAADEHRSCWANGLQLGTQINF